MKSATSLQARVEQYLAERRRLGFSIRTPACSLRGFVRHMQDRGVHITPAGRFFQKIHSSFDPGVLQGRQDRPRQTKGQATLHKLPACHHPRIAAFGKKVSRTKSFRTMVPG